MLLDVRDINVHYGKVEAVRRVCLQVMEGEIVTLLGANGAGKTTVLRAISGLEYPTSGEIWFSGRRIDKIRPSQVVRRGVGHVPEGRGLFPNMKVEENLLMGAYARRNGKAIQQDLQRIYRHFPRLEERKSQRAYSMSGGEQQMVAIGRALMCRPKLLLLDEPSLGLSPVMVDEIAAIIREIHKQGITVLMVEQNAAIALGLADRGYVMEIGQIVVMGTKEELYKDSRVKRAYLGR
jgi:branched-chain amino acid transport system ATP-binding protein